MAHPSTPHTPAARPPGEHPRTTTEQHSHRPRGEPTPKKSGAGPRGAECPPVITESGLSSHPSRLYQFILSAP